ncbi:hypothetical protein HYT84_03795, partial [Candidatus Micrarchaeota archaeon]|nr:hypothetical protein [Candidatus Micrarchaeota archaeon]
MKFRILKKNDKCYVELPEEFMVVEELELTPAKDGIYLLTFEKPTNSKKPEPPQKKELRIETPERAVLQKLISIKFEKRTPAFVTSTFSEAEKNLLKEQKKKK